MELTSQQHKALNLIKDFVVDKGKSVFILKGYAGTGKTTMIKTLIPEIQKIGKQVKLMAPTGRAAKVLRDKTGCCAYTIHRGIYAFNKMQAIRHDEAGKRIETNQTKGTEIRSKGSDDLQFWFGIKQHEIGDDPAKNVYIIDESSMVSSRAANNETLHFGTDVLIDDLLTYAQLHLGGKIIFVGDPAQLPPVGDNRSVALDEIFFADKSLGVSSFELTEVLRQEGKSAILSNAMKVRNLLFSDTRNQLNFDRKEGEVEDMTTEQVIESYYETMPTPMIGGSVVLCYTNSLVKEYNDAIRRIYFPHNNDVVAGDILQVVRNIVNSNLGIELFNGDFVRVLEVSENPEIISAPVWSDIAGTRERLNISLSFRDAVLQAEDGTQVKCKIVDSLLNSREPNLTPLQSVAMYINFRIRHPQLKQNEEAFKETLMNDPYFNAVQVKYGYAITGHKSQGGEWNTAYVDYTGRTGLNDDCLRWVYTATTRAGKMLYGVNMPNITPISGLKFNPIIRYGKPAKEAFAYADVKDVVELPNTAAAFQKQKYISVKGQLDEKGYFLKSIQACQYNDKYAIETPSGSVVIDCFYNGAGQYTRFMPESILPENDILIEVMNNEHDMQFSVDYKPSCESFDMLFGLMQSVCDNLDITITNVVEHLQQYYVAYYLRTSGKFSQILFYFKGNQALSHAIPSSDLGNDDDKLNRLIEHFN
jgi:hypothetical protein